MPSSATLAATDGGWNGLNAADRTFVQLKAGVPIAQANSHKIVITDCYIDACYATPSAPLPLRRRLG